MNFSSVREKLPKSAIARRVIGGLLIAGGLLGFLPVLGFWMIPLGLVVLSVDSASARRIRRRMEVRWGRFCSGTGKSRKNEEN